MNEPFTFTGITPNFERLASFFGDCIIPRDCKVILKVRTFTASEVKKIFSFKYPSSLETFKPNRLYQLLVRSNNSVIFETMPAYLYEEHPVCEASWRKAKLLKLEVSANGVRPYYEDVTPERRYAEFLSSQSIPDNYYKPFNKKRITVITVKFLPW